VTGPNHHRFAEKPVWDADRQGVEDDFQCGRIRHMAVTLTVDKFGLDTHLFSFVNRFIRHAVARNGRRRCEIL